MSSKDLVSTFRVQNTEGQKLLASWNHKEKAHRHKQRLEKTYILHRLIDAEKKAKQDEKIQEVH